LLPKLVKTFDLSQSLSIRFNFSLEDHYGPLERGTRTGKTRLGGRGVEEGKVMAFFAIKSDVGLIGFMEIHL
jgi:hypothetical protein